MSRDTLKSFVLLTLLVYVLPVQAIEKPLSLWLLESGESKIYLLGSIHAMKPDMYPLAAPIEAAFRESHKIVFEVDLTRLNETTMSQVMKQYGFYTPPASIESDLSVETLSLLKNYLRDNNLKLANVRQMKPWFLMLTIGQKELSKYGFEPRYGIDHIMQQRALEKGKEILQLESFGTQIELLSGDPIEVQELSLKVSLEEMPSLKGHLDELISAWEIGDADEMLRLAMAGSDEHPQLNEQMYNLIVKRNMQMTDKIRGYVAASGTYFVVVGALHMGGENGIVQLLSKEFSVTQLRH